MSRRIAIYVQHLLGAGHLVRAMTLAEALADRGQEVLLLAGGFPIERAPGNYAYLQLPPTRAVGGDFSRLVDEFDKPLTDQWRRRRADRLLSVLQRFAPQMIVTETYPFGRRQFRFELEPLLKWVGSQGSIRLVASIRDVLQRRAADRDEATIRTVRRYYDAVLVHGDERLFRLDASFPLAAKIADRLIYTGYIHQPPQTPPQRVNPGRGLPGDNEVLVSGGSGSVSAGLLEAAQQARGLSKARDLTWRLLTGRGRRPGTVRPAPGLIIQPNRSDFFELLGRCALSVSQAGYNTSLDVLASGARSVMVPFAGDGETEQTDRALALERAGRLVQLSESELTPERLARAVDHALEMEPSSLSVNLDGAASSAEVLLEMLSK